MPNPFNLRSRRGLAAKEDLDTALASLTEAAAVPLSPPCSNPSRAERSRRDCLIVSQVSVVETHRFLLEVKECLIEVSSETSIRTHRSLISLPNGPQHHKERPSLFPKDMDRLRPRRLL